MDAILNSIDRKQWCGRRDYALLLTMYNLGARVSEISGLRQSHAYLHANLAMKERALAKVLPVGTPFRRFQANDTLLAFLESL